MNCNILNQNLLQQRGIRKIFIILAESLIINLIVSTSILNIIIEKYSFFRIRKIIMSITEEYNYK